MKANSLSASLPILPVLFTTAGILIIAGSLFLAKVTGRALPAGAGKFVALQDMLIWRNPPESAYQRMSLARALFHVRNVGDAPPRMIELRSSRGCATSTVRPTTIPIGHVGVIIPVSVEGDEP